MFWMHAIFDTYHGGVDSSLIGIHFIHFCTFPVPISSSHLVKHLRKGNSFNLDINVLGKGLDGDAASSRLVGEPLLILGVHVLMSTVSCC